MDGTSENRQKQGGGQCGGGRHTQFGHEQNDRSVMILGTVWARKRIFPKFPKIKLLMRPKSWNL